MEAADRNLGCPAAAFLTKNLRKIHRGTAQNRFGGHTFCGWAVRIGVCEITDGFSEVSDADHPDIFDQGGFLKARIWDHYHADAGFAGMYDPGKYSVDRTDLAVQTQLPHNQTVIQNLPVQIAGRGHDGSCDRQIESGSLLSDIRRSQIDGNPFWRKLDPVVFQGSTDPVLSFSDLTRSIAYNVENGKSIADVRLYPDRKDLHTINHGCCYIGKQLHSFPQSMTASLT